jgi:hypothetical protein
MYTYVLLQISTKMWWRPGLGGYAHVSMMTGVRLTGLRREAARVPVGAYYSRRGKIQTDKRVGGTGVVCKGSGTDPSSRFRGSTCSGVQGP